MSVNKGFVGGLTREKDHSGPHGPELSVTTGFITVHHYTVGLPERQGGVETIESNGTGGLTSH